MKINLEIKDRVAKLLATEDIIVEHNNRSSTATFNMFTRVLTLPVWAHATNDMYDMLISHEVGHALFTPYEEWRNCDLNKSYTNIIEDIRIEKLMKRKYAGIAKCFFNGYKDLAKQDFLCIKNKNLSSFIFIDRINIHYKIGHFVNVPFCDNEKDILKMIDELETFDDVLRLTKLISDFCKKESSRLPELDLSGNQSNNSCESSENEIEINPEKFDIDDLRDEIADDLNDDIDNNQEDNSTNQNRKDKDNLEDLEEPEPKTLDNLQESLKQLCDISTQTIYLKAPKIDLDDYIVKYDTVKYDLCLILDREYYIKELNSFMSRRYTTINANTYENEYDYTRNCAETEYDTFKNSSKKEVSYLIKEFESKKSANSYNRTLYAKTGVLDCKKIHSYMYNEDIFKKITITPNEKNHGLIFILDWSGSMGSVLESTLKQLYYLLWFCKKANIHFDVYAFSSNLRKKLPQKVIKREINTFDIGIDNGLLHILTSNCSARELEEQMRNVFLLCKFVTVNSHNQFPSFIPYALGATPLNESLLLLPDLIQKFKEKTRAQKIHITILTDGESQEIKYFNDDLRCKLIPNIPASSSRSYFFQNKKTKKLYCINNREQKIGLTNVLIENLNDQFNDVNFLGFRLISSRSHVDKVLHSHHRNVPIDIINKYKKEYDNNGSFVLPDTSYSGMFVLNSTLLNKRTNTVFSLSESQKLTKSMLTKHALKYFENKKMNKKILNEFVNCIV